MKQELLDCLDDLHGVANDLTEQSSDGPTLSALLVHDTTSRIQELLVEQDTKLQEAAAVIDNLTILADDCIATEWFHDKVKDGLSKVSELLHAYRDGGNATCSVAQVDRVPVRGEVAGSSPA